MDNQSITNADCGTGAGGFKPGNTCAIGSATSTSSDKDYTEKDTIKKDGKPLIMYRGTSSDSLDPHGGDGQGKMVFLAPEKSFADRYAGQYEGKGKVHAVTIKAKHVIDIGSGDGYQIWKDFKKETKAPSYASVGTKEGIAVAWTHERQFKEWLDKKGIQYDAIYFGENDNSRSLAVKSVKQLEKVKDNTTNLNSHIDSLIINSLRYVDVNGREFAVASIRILRPQVLEGSKGKLYYPPDEISKDYDRWNGMPMVVYHPNKDGKNVSARHPEVMQKQEVGRIYNARITSDNELDVEGWFDVELTKKIDARVWKNLQEGRPIEVSTGLFTKDEPAPLNSKYKDKEYTHVARNYNPDHLAILPDQVGACSIKDGCGVFTINGDASYTYNSVPSSFTVNPSWVVDEALWEKAKQAATEEGQPDNYALITEIYKRMGGAINNTDDSQQDNSDTQTTGNTMDRTKSVDWLVANCDCYKNVTGAKDVLLKMNVDQYATVFTNNAKEAIENEDSKFFDWMNNASDDIKGAFVKMIKNKIIRQTGNEFPPVKGKEDDKKTEVPPVEESEEEKKKKAAMMAEQQGAATNRRMTEEQYIASLPPSLQEVLNNAKQVTEREKTRLVNTLTQHITDNTQKANAQKVLMAKTLPDLQERVALMPPVPKTHQQTNNLYNHSPDVVNDFYPATPDYSGAAGYPVGNANDGYDINKDVLDTGPTFNWVEMSKEHANAR